MATYWVVAASYQGYSTLFDEKCEEIVGKPRSGSGLGMGWRDLDWTFDSEAEANEASEQLSRRGIQSTISSYDTEKDQ
jgi:hypothetical protein